MPAPAGPRPDDVEIPQWVSRHRGLVSAAPRWIKLNVMRYVDAYGKERLWEWASRTTKGAAAVDAAVVVAVLHSRKTGLRQLVLVEQYRPPMDRMTLELPAGLVDKGETIEEAALRELKEETGYTGTVEHPASPALAGDPGMTSATLSNVFVAVDADAPENQDVSPSNEVDSGEQTNVHLVDLNQLAVTCEAYAKAGGSVDSRLYALALGMGIAKGPRETLYFQAGIQAGLIASAAVGLTVWGVAAGVRRWRTR